MTFRWQREQRATAPETLEGQARRDVATDQREEVAVAVVQLRVVVVLHFCDDGGLTWGFSCGYVRSVWYTKYSVQQGITGPNPAQPFEKAKAFYPATVPA